MSPSIATTVTRVMGGDPKEVPRWSQPIVFEKSQQEYRAADCGPALV